MQGEHEREPDRAVVPGREVDVQVPFRAQSRGINAVVASVIGGEIEDPAAQGGVDGVEFAGSVGEERRQCDRGRGGRDHYHTGEQSAEPHVTPPLYRMPSFGAIDGFDRQCDSNTAGRGRIGCQEMSPRQVARRRRVSSKLPKR